MDWIYLVFFPLAILLVLLTYILAQNPRGRSNRIFALYALLQAGGTYAALVMTTTSSPTLAAIAATVVAVVVLPLNGAFLLALVLALYYRGHLTRWYGLPLVLGGGALLSLAAILDAAAGWGYLMIMPQTMGHGYTPLAGYLHGPATPVLWAWFGLTVLCALVLLVFAWRRAPRDERAPIAWIILAIAAASAATPLLPPSPLVTATTPLLFFIPLSIAVLRHRLFLPAEAVTRAVFRGTYSGLVACDREGSVVQINPAAGQLLGLTEPQARGRPAGEVLAPLLAQVQDEPDAPPLAEVLARGWPEPIEVLLRLPGPPSRTVEAASQPINDERGRSLGFVLSLRDVSESERARQALEEKALLVETIRELSTPIIPVLEGVLILPLVGTIDSARADQIMPDMLAAIRRHRARVILIDITGVPVVDTQVAHYLLQSLQGARLLGCEGILVGIRAEVARTLVELGVDLSTVETRGSLQDGLQHAMERMGSTQKPLSTR